jgi:hypothetical protein
MTEKNRITVWVTKYALSQGIIKMEVENISDDMVVEVGAFRTYYHKPHWHETEEEAVAHAEKMRKKKVASLQKKIGELTNLVFKIEEV